MKVRLCTPVPWRRFVYFVLIWWIVQSLKPVARRNSLMPGSDCFDPWEFGCAI